MVSFGGQKKLGPCPDQSPLLVCLKSLILSFTCNFFAYFKFYSNGGQIIGKIKQNELDCRDTAPLKVKWTKKLKYILLSFYLHQPLKRTIGYRFFFPSLYWEIKDQNLNKLFWNGCAMAGFSFCWLFVCVVLWEFWLRLNKIHKVWMFSLCKACLFVIVVVCGRKHFQRFHRVLYFW